MYLYQKDERALPWFLQSRKIFLSLPWNVTSLIAARPLSLAYPCSGFTWLMRNAMKVFE
jgi:hypothetical protein